MDLRNQIPIHTETLDNGLQFVFVRKKDAPIVNINLAYKVGSKDEKPGRTGFAHLFEHLMFEGSLHVPKGEFDKLCSAAGGTNNAYTTYDYTAYTMTLPKHQIELGLWLESDRMFFSNVIPEALETQQKVVSEEIRQTVFQRPYGIWREKLSEGAFTPECSYSWEVHGSIKDVTESSLEDVRSFFNMFYVPANACLTIVGDYENDEIGALVKKYFNIEKKGPTIERNDFSSNFKLGGVTTGASDAVPHEALFLAYHGPDFKNDESLAGDIICYIAGNGKSSMLYDAMLRKKQIASSIGAFNDKREFTSLTTFYAIGNAPEVTGDELASVIRTQVDRFAKGDFTDEMLEKAVNTLSIELASEIEYGAGIADMVCNNALFWDDPERVYEFLDKYKAVTKDDIINYAQKYLKPGNMIRVSITPSGQDGGDSEE